MSEMRSIQSIMNEAGSRGIRVDFAKLLEVEWELQRKMNSLVDQLDEIVGHSGMRYTSRKEVRNFLLDEGLIDDSQKSIARDTLAHIVHPFLEPYFEFLGVRRTLSLLNSSRQFFREDRIHTVWQCENETTGRIYCRDANVQQLPIPIRHALVPDEGFRFVHLDFKHFEFRVLALLSGLEVFQEILADDPHQAVLDRMPTERTDRTFGKVLNFGIVFGMNEKGLSSRLNVSVEEAKVLLEEYFQAIPGLEDWIEDQIFRAREQGYVSTLFGHQRVLDPQLLVDNPEKIDRIIINTLVQGTAAELLKILVMRLDRDFPSVQVLSTVHDSIQFQVPESEELEPILDSLKIQLGEVEFLFDFAVAPSWGEAQEAC